MKRVASVLFVMIICCIMQINVSAGTDNLAKDANSEVLFYNKEGRALAADLSKISALTDDNNYSLYQTPVGVENGEIIIDLYYPQNFNQVYLREINSAIYGFEIYTSLSKDGWTKQFTGSTVGVYGANACFKTVYARYVKIVLTKTANQYGDAAVTFSDIKVFCTSDIVTDDLKNAVYLAEQKQKYMMSDGMKSHFTDEERALISKEISQAKETLEKGLFTQSTVNRMCAGLNNHLLMLNSNERFNETDFDRIEQRYLDYFIKNNLEMTEERIRTIHTLERTVSDIRRTMIRQPKAAQLWAEYIPPMANSTQEPGKIANSFAKIKQMAIAYKQEGNQYYGDEDVYQDILYGINYLLDTKYNPSVKMYGNWYYWQISVPATMTDIMVILKEDLPDDLMERMRAAIIYRIGDDFHYTWYGANRMYLAAISLKLGTAVNNAEYIHRAVYALSEENACKDKQSVNSSGDDNGYFWDGSYMFHSGILYNATYGRDQLSNTLSIIGYLYETPWQIEQGMIDDMAERIPDVYEYIVYNGYSIDAAAGRGLGEGENYGKSISDSIAKLAEYLDDPKKTELLSVAKQFKTELGIDDEITGNPSIPSRGRISKLKRYPIGDKLILHTSDFGFALSMFSDRTKCFEAPNGDAMKAWYVSSGMTQILNDDRTQYDRNYWIAVNHYRLPGTTVDTIARSLTRYEGEIYNANDWCGMIDHNELYGAAGMIENNWNSSLTAKKSYFIFDDEIVCLGTDISNGTAEIETTVENRKIKNDKTNRVTVNGEIFNEETDTVKANVKTVWLEANNNKNHMGWYFPYGADLHMLKETRTDAEADMWLSDSDKTVTENFFTMWYNHGKHPQNQSYEYVILPNYTEEQVMEYNKNPDIEIIDKTSDVHSVRDRTIGVTGYNFWNKRGGRGSGVRTDGALTLMVAENDNEMEVSLTDPTFKAERPVKAEFDCSVKSISEIDDRITVLNLNPLQIKVDLNDINGKKISFKAIK